MPASELENSVIHTVIAFLGDETEWMKAVDLIDLSPDGCARLKRHMRELISRLEASHPSIRKQALHEITERITVQPGMISIILKRNGLNPEGEITQGETSYEFNVPFHTKRRGVESKIIIGGRNPKPTPPDQNLIDVIQRSFTWHRLITEEPNCSIDRLAKLSSINASDVTRFLPLAFLAPDIVEAILTGRQPVDLNVERLKKISPIPADWMAQRRRLGINI